MQFRLAARSVFTELGHVLEGVFIPLGKILVTPDMTALAVRSCQYTVPCWSDGRGSAAAVLDLPGVASFAGLGVAGRMPLAKGVEGEGEPKT